MANEYPNHDWSADQFHIIRDPFCASVDRAWCADPKARDPWRWNVFRTDTDDCSSIVPDEVKQHGFTFAGAIAAAEAFIGEQETSEKRQRWARFEDVPMPASEEVCF